jgi:hypothetical protein
MTAQNKKKPYSERTDLEKIKSNWTKTHGLFKREEYSMAIVRAATAAEIAANLVIRKELEEKRGLDFEFVDNLLIWANGIQGKFDRLILPVTKGTKKHDVFKKVKNKVSELNKERNSIAHSGQFKKESTAIKMVNLAKEVIEKLVGRYEKKFKLQKIG